MHEAFQVFEAVQQGVVLLGVDGAAAAATEPAQSIWSTKGLLSVESLIALVTLTALEVVLGIDNIVFIAILAGKLPPEQRDKARKIGIALAAIVRLLLLSMIGVIISLKKDVFTVLGMGFSGKDLILLGGGLFLIYKATKEIHHKVEGQGDALSGVAATSFRAVIFQILLVDAVFSIDSVITAVGMAKHIYVMMAAVLLSVGVMIFAARPVITFVDRHPTIKILALSFLLLIGVMLTIEAFEAHISHGYIYFAMAFSLTVEVLQMRMQKNAARKAGGQNATPPGAA